MLIKRQPVMETIIGIDSTIRGDLNSKGTLRIDGTVEGRVRADWVVVGEAGRINGNIVCRGTIVGGKVEGIIRSSEIVDIKSKGAVLGDIYTVKLAVSEGGLFEGRSHMSREKEKEHGSVLPFLPEKQPL
jgi:cytoskeletal protein CcmA (bactofilin family)